MDFPMDNPLLKFLYWLLNTPGLGALVVGILGGSLAMGFGLTLRWIAQGSQAREREVYTYPTAGLHHDQHDT